MASVSWTTLFNESPTIADRVRNTPVFIQQTRAAVQERLAVEHCLDVTDGGSQNDHGKHLQGSARVFVQASAPTAATVTPDNADYSTGRVYLNSTNGRLSIYRDSAWNTTIRVSNADLADLATNATLAANATNAYACSGNAATASNASQAALARELNGAWSSSGTFVVSGSTGRNLVIPAGLYTITGTSDGYPCYLQIFNGSSWVGGGYDTAQFDGGTVYSDGSNVRLLGPIAGTNTFYYIRWA